MRTLKLFWKDVQRRKHALLIGGLVGLAAAQYVISQGQDLTTIVESGKGVIDGLMTRSSPVQLAQYKVYGAFLIMGAGLGYIFDLLLDVFSAGGTRRRRRVPSRRRRRR